MDVAETLKRLQRTVRNTTGPSRNAAVQSEYRDTLVRLRRDARYSDIDDLDDLVAGFCDACERDRTTDRVLSLILDLEQRAEDVRSHVLLLAVSGLTVAAPVVLGDVDFIAADAWPESSPLNPEVRGLARVTVRGSITDPMVSKARAKVEDAMAKLRINAAGQGALDSQLRFHLDGHWTWADGGRGGWWRTPQQLVSLEVGPVLLEPDRAHPVTVLPYPAQTDVQKRAQFALMWLDQAARADEPLLRTVLPLFALEALVGDRSEKLKANSLVFYRIMLGATVSGWWTSPNALHTFYREIRSHAVHGSIPAREASKANISFLNSDARSALREYLILCEREGFTKRSQLLGWLTTHQLAAEITAWLAEHDPAIWGGWEPPTSNNLVAELLTLVDDLTPQEAADFIRRVQETAPGR
jgi:hypothetical protein